jgi:hypothetical protein
VVIVRAAQLSHDCCGPALDLSVNGGAAPDINAQAAVVVRADVLAHRLRVVALKIATMRLVLGALAPISDGARDQDLAIV